MRTSRHLATSLFTRDVWDGAGLEIEPLCGNSGHESSSGSIQWQFARKKTRTTFDYTIMGSRYVGDTTWVGSTKLLTTKTAPSTIAGHTIHGAQE
jgi:hypothetical protein